MESKRLHFDVSTGLKSVLGSELITDDEVAIFELVKNSFDALATHVDIAFEDNSITISDNGHGMSLEDIEHKWLLVAYSAKREESERKDFRQSIANRRHYAGSKGIGRFSSDRLGREVVLQTRAKGENRAPVHQITVNWDRFERDPQRLFQSVGVDYAELKQFDLPIGVDRLTHGTVVRVRKARERWDRVKILRLKSALAKLINPFGAPADGFTIAIVAPAENDEDREEIKRFKSSDDGPPPNSLVNGPVGNFIFEALKQKTTFVDVNVSGDGAFLESKLTDRGELIYSIREPNPYRQLRGSGVNCQIYFLNTSAKQTFARRMGVPSVQFGSVFLFRNGFRVYPVGEESDDWFGMDHRKQQGYARFLGTRDVIGRIEIFDGRGTFQEASSRNQGLIESDAVEELREFFMEYCLKRLEKYVVPVTFPDKEDRNTEDISRLRTDPGRARVAAVVAKLVDNEDVELLDYSKQLIRILSARSDRFEESLSSFRAIAERTKDSKLFRKIEEAEERFTELKRSEEAARRQADKERVAKEEAQARAQQAEVAATIAGAQLEEEKKRNLFLTSISSFDADTVINLHHQITIYAVDANQQIENFLVEIRDQKSISASVVVDTLEGLAFLTRRIMGITRFATKANFRLESEKIKADLSAYIEQYINGVARDYLSKKVSVDVTSDGHGFEQSFKPIDVSIVVDNLISNAQKAKATRVRFDITHPNRNVVNIRVTDNGKGLDRKIADASRIFEKGVSTTDGSGLGLFHVQQVLGEMNGTIEVVDQESPGLSFLIRISK
jgi:signal transduction histidine kinase